jgi:hypothetical protein
MSQEKKHLRRLDGARLFAALSSPGYVEALGYSLFVDPFCFRDGAFGF